MRTYTVGIFELGEEYGGPEEGGWWYSTGTPAPEFAHLTRTFKGRARKAVRYMARIRKHAEAASRGARPVHSVLYSGGQYDARMQNGNTARAWPQRCPRYE